MIYAYSQHFHRLHTPDNSNIPKTHNKEKGVPRQDSHKKDLDLPHALIKFLTKCLPIFPAEFGTGNLQGKF